MGIKEKMMDNMMGKMSTQEKKDMMDKMMENFFSSMTEDEKKEMMNSMMPKMMEQMMGSGSESSGDGMMNMMQSMMSGNGSMMNMMGSMMENQDSMKGMMDHSSSKSNESISTGFNPMEMCKKMMSTISQSNEIATYATPEVRQLFEDWVLQVDEEILGYIKDTASVDPDQIAEHLKISKNSVIYFLTRLAQKDKLKIKIDNL